MDSLITAAARMLAAGDPIGALKLVALRNDASGLALRGIALAQLGEHARARELLRSAANAFSPREAVARARCILAEAEIALVSRDLTWTTKRLNAARETLERNGDAVNAAHARYIEIRRLLLIGKLDEAEKALIEVPARLPLPLKIGHELIVAQLALRRVQPKLARAALLRAGRVAQHAGIPALIAEVESAIEVLNTPAARLIAKNKEKLLLLDDVEALLASKAFIVDGCRHVVRQGDEVISLATRPVLLTLARVLAEAWPDDVPRDELVRRAFRLRLADETHRARLRVEIGRLRKLLRAMANIDATPRGFVLTPRRANDVVVLARPVEDKHADVLAFLADGESWSTSALAQALGASQRTVQRSLDSLAVTGKVQSIGRGRSQRWMTPPPPGFTTLLLLPAALPTG
jgi:DNA-binding transcriptional ArsR family regulator